MDSELDVVIERATRADGAALLTLLAAQLADHDIAFEPAGLHACIDGVFADASRGVFLVARERGEIAGLAYLSFTWCLEHGGRSAWLEELYVAPSRRQRGIGRALLSKACEVAAHEGCRAVDLEVESSHARAANLYLRMGFRPHTRARWVRVVR